jgi:hypothetical protein
VGSFRSHYGSVHTVFIASAAHIGIFRAVYAGQVIESVAKNLNFALERVRGRRAALTISKSMDAAESWESSDDGSSRGQRRYGELQCFSSVGLFSMLRAPPLSFVGVRPTTTTTSATTGSS